MMSVKSVRQDKKAQRSLPVVPKFDKSAPKQRLADRRSHDRVKQLRLDFDRKKKSRGYSSEGEEYEESVAAAKLFIDPLVKYQFKISTTGNATSSVPGVVAGYISFNPTGLAEFTSLSNLFDYVRIVEAKATLIAINPHSDGYATGRINAFIAVSCDAGQTAGTPASLATVIDCPNLLCFSPAEPKPQVIRYHAPSDLNWATVAAPIPGAFAGCYGEFQYYQSGLSSSVAYFSYVFEGIYEFTSRT